MLALLLLAGGSCWLFMGQDPILAEIDAYAATESQAARELEAQLAAIRSGQSVNVANEKGYTPLMNAARSGNLEAVDFLLIKKARLHRKGPDGQKIDEMAEGKEIQALLQACALAERNPNESEKASMRRSLADARISPDDLNRALFEAVSSWRGDSLNLTATVLALGGNANAVNSEGQHILQVRHRNPGTVVLLLRQGADPNAVQDAHGGSMALLQNAGSNMRNVRNLLTAGARVKGALTLAKAAGSGEAALTRQLLELGADANGVAENGKTVLEHAVQGLGVRYDKTASPGIPECVRMLLQAGAKTEYTPQGGKTRSPISPGGISIQPECLRLLLDAGADVNAHNSRGANYAQIAAYKRLTPENLELLEDIIDAGADLKHVDDKGETFLFYALPSMCALAVTDPDEHRREEAEQLLDDMLDIISDAEPDPAALDRNGNTALHLAVIRRDTADDKVVEFLLKLGVDPSVRNQFGRTALEAMLRNPCGPRSKYVARLLTSKGPLPSDPGLQLVLAAMMDDTAAIRRLLEHKPEPAIMAVALGCVQNAAAADLLLKAGAPCHYANMQYMVRYGNPDVVRIFAAHKRLNALESHWESVRTQAMAKAFVEAGLMPHSASDIANDTVLAYLLSLPGFNPNATSIDIRNWGMPVPLLTELVSKGRSRMTRLLLNHGAAVNGYVISPLAEAQDAGIAEMLIEHGTDLTWRSPGGDTLLSQHKSTLRGLARDYKESPSAETLERFRNHLAIAGMLEDADVSDIHPRRDAIKRALQRGDSAEYFETVEFVTKGWSGPVRISEEAMVMARASGNDDAANILSMGPDSIKFKWDRWGFGYVVRKPDGKFHQVFDEDRYRDFKKNPQKTPHFFFEFEDESGSKTRLLIHNDCTYAMREDTGATAVIRNWTKGRHASLTLDWDKGGSSRIIHMNNRACVLNATTAKQLLQEYSQHLIKYDEIQVVGNSWNDTLRISREYMVAARTSRSRDTANVTQFNDKRLTLKWDRWGEESFIRHNDGKYYKDDSRKKEAERIRKLILEENPQIRIRKFSFAGADWQDTVAISFKHRVAVRKGGRHDAATVIRYDKKSITLKWDSYGEETFERQPNGVFKLVK